jgi:hypothetical protein
VSKNIPTPKYNLSRSIPLPNFILPRKKVKKKYKKVWIIRMGIVSLCQRKEIKNFVYPSEQRGGNPHRVCEIPMPPLKFYGLSSTPVLFA